MEYNAAQNRAFQQIIPVLTDKNKQLAWENVMIYKKMKTISMILNKWWMTEMTGKTKEIQMRQQRDLIYLQDEKIVFIYDNIYLICF